MFNKKLPSKDNAKRSSFGLSQQVYKTLNALLPIVLLLLIRADLVVLSIIVALFSKWRVFTVKPRHLWANIRTNAVDIIVKLSTLSFMVQANESILEQLAWTAWYILWLVVIKPGASTAAVSLQAMIGQALGLSALMYYSNNIASIFIYIAAWAIGLASARHFLGSYEEPESGIMAGLWGFFVLQMTWVLNQWTLVYVFVPQLVFVVVMVGYAIGSIYDAYKKEKLKTAFMRQQITVALVVLFVLIVIGDFKGEI